MNEQIADFLRTIDSTLNGTPFLFQFSCNKEFNNPIDLFCYILKYKTIDLYMQFYYNIMDNHPIDFDEYKHLFYKMDLVFNRTSMDMASYRHDAEKNIMHGHVSYKAIADNTMVSHLHSMVSPVDSPYHHFSSFYNRWQPVEQGKELVEKFLNVIQGIDHNWKYLYVEPKFDFTVDQSGNRYFEHLGNDSCTLFYTDKNMLVLLTQGTD